MSTLQSRFWCQLCRAEIDVFFAEQLSVADVLQMPLPIVIALGICKQYRQLDVSISICKGNAEIILMSLLSSDLFRPICIILMDVYSNIFH